MGNSIKKTATLFMALSLLLSILAIPAYAETTFTLSQKTLTLGVGDNFVITAAINPDSDVKWCSLNPEVVSVSKGKVTGKKAGTASVMAVAGGKAVICKIVVKNAPEVVIAKNMTIYIGERQPIVLVLPPDTESVSRTYAISDEKIAMVDSSGTVIGVSVGNCIVTIKTGNGKTCEAKITVKEETNTRGNSTGNSVNRGRAAISGDWIYYGDVTGGLFKIRTDGTGKTKLSDDRACGEINVVGSWVYYSGYDNKSGMFKMRTDGTEKIKLSNEYGESVNIVDGWIYYNVRSSYEYSLIGGNTANCVPAPSWYLYKMRTDGTKKTQLNGERGSYINVVGDWIYYGGYSVNDGMKMMRTDGSEKKRLKDIKSKQVNVEGDWIYYGMDNGLFKVRSDGSETTVLSSDDCAGINVVGDWVYYLNRDGGDSNIFKIRTDGTEKTQLNSDNCYYFSIVGDWIYYIDGDAYRVYKIRTDGTNRRLA